MLYPPNSTPSPPSPPQKKYIVYIFLPTWDISETLSLSVQSDVWLSAVLTVILRDAVVTPGLKGRSEILRCICRCIFKQIIQSHYREGRSFPPVLPSPTDRTFHRSQKGGCSLGKLNLPESVKSYQLKAGTAALYKIWSERYLESLGFASAGCGEIWIK